MRAEPVHPLALGLAEGQVLDPDPVGIGVNPFRHGLDAIGREQPDAQKRQRHAPPSEAQPPEIEDEGRHDERADQPPVPCHVMEKMHALAGEEQVAHLERLAGRFALDGRERADEQETGRQQQGRGDKACEGGEDAQHHHRHHHARGPEVPEIAALEIVRRPGAEIGMHAEDQQIGEGKLQRHAQEGRRPGPLACRNRN